MANQQQVSEAENLYNQAQIFENNLIKELSDLQKTVKDKDIKLSNDLNWLNTITSQTFCTGISTVKYKTIYNTRSVLDTVYLAMESKRPCTKSVSGFKDYLISNDLKDVYLKRNYEANDLRGQINIEKSRINDMTINLLPKAKLDTKEKYKQWIDFKKAMMTAQELSEYNNIGVDAQSNIVKDRNKTFAIIGVSFVALLAIGYYIYRRFLS